MIMTPKRAERTEHDYRYSTCRTAIGIYSRNEVRRPPYWQAIVTVATLPCSKATVDFLAIIPSLKMCQMKANTTGMLKPGTPAEHPENLAVGTYVKWKNTNRKPKPNLYNIKIKCSFCCFICLTFFSPGVTRVGFLGTALNYKNKQTKTTK